MHSALSGLVEEHRLIMQALIELRRAAAEGSPSQLAQVVTFLREYVDELHHSKEEKVLFASLCEHGMPRNAGPIAVMHMEHAQGRTLVSDLGEIATNAAPWGDGVQQRANELALVFAELLASHIAKENNVLYPLAERQLTPDVLDDVGVRFAALESEFGVERRDALLASVAPRSSS